MKAAIVIVSALLAAGCAQNPAYHTSNPAYVKCQYEARKAVGGMELADMWREAELINMCMSLQATQAQQ